VLPAFAGVTERPKVSPVTMLTGLSGLRGRFLAHGASTHGAGRRRLNHQGV